MSTNYTTTQVFPAGRLIRHTGSYPHFVDESGNEFDAETQDDIQANLLAENYVRNEVLCCDSALVDELSRRSYESNGIDGFSVEDMENLYPDPSDWTVEECREYIEGHGGECPEVDDSDDDCLPDGIDEWRQAVSDCAEPAEPYEWWRVTEWLCRQLRDIGEVVIDNGYGYWWGRTCTGQRMIMDGTLQAVAMQSLARTNELIGR